jgi:hypothetical protein
MGFLICYGKQFKINELNFNKEIMKVRMIFKQIIKILDRLPG